MGVRSTSYSSNAERTVENIFPMRFAGNPGVDQPGADNLPRIAVSVIDILTGVTKPLAEARHASPRRISGAVVPPGSERSLFRNVKHRALIKAGRPGQRRKRTRFLQKMHRLGYVPRRTSSCIGHHYLRVLARSGAGEVDLGQNAIRALVGSAHDSLQTEKNGENGGELHPRLKSSAGAIGPPIFPVFFRKLSVFKKF